MWCGEPFKSYSDPLDTHQCTCRHTRTRTHKVTLDIALQLNSSRGFQMCQHIHITGVRTSTGLPGWSRANKLCTSLGETSSKAAGAQNHGKTARLFVHAANPKLAKSCQSLNEVCCWLLFLWWMLIFAICTYVECWWHLVGQEVGRKLEMSMMFYQWEHRPCIQNQYGAQTWGCRSVAWNLAESKLHLDLSGQLLPGGVIFPCLQMDLLGPSDVWQRTCPWVTLIFYWSIWIADIWLYDLICFDRKALFSSSLLFVICIATRLVL